MISEGMQIAALMLRMLAVDSAIAKAKPALPEETRALYAAEIVRESAKAGLDPFLVLAVGWHESKLRADLVSPTADYGILQVHWQRGAHLKGLRREDLLDAATNIRAGVAELAMWKKRCPRARPHWVHCYKWGYKVGNPRYQKKVIWRYLQFLKHSQPPLT